MSFRVDPLSEKSQNSGPQSAPKIQAQASPTSVHLTVSSNSTWSFSFRSYYSPVEVTAMLSHLCQTPGSHSRFIFLPSYCQAIEFHLLQKSEIHPLLSIPTAPAPTQPFNSRHVDCGHGVQKWNLVPHNQQRIRSWHLLCHPIRAPLQCPGACRVIPSFPAQALGSLPPSSWHPAPSSCHLLPHPVVHATATLATVCKVFAKCPSLCPTACCLVLSSRPTHSIARSQGKRRPLPRLGGLSAPLSVPMDSSLLHVTSHTAVVLPRWLGGKESTRQHWRCGFNPWVGKIPWTRKWQPTPVFLPGESHGQRSLVGCAHGVSEPDGTEHTCMLTLTYLLVSPFPRGHQLFKGLCLPSVALTPT